MEINETGELPEEVVDNNTVSDSRKITIINLILQFSKGNDFSIGCERIKGFQSITEPELAFIDEVSNILQSMKIEENMTKREAQEQLKEALYQELQISQEAIEQDSDKNQELKEQASAKIEEQRALWRAQDEEAFAGKMTIREDLYRPEFLCGRAIGTTDKPFVELIKYTQERVDKAAHSYQAYGRDYTIKKTGELVYMPTPNLQECLSKYEITISKAGMSRTIERYGEICFHKMDDANYKEAVLSKLLEVSNLKDVGLQGYIGSLERVQDEKGRQKNEYQVVHLPEEYTAMLIWREIEKEREERKNRNANTEIVAEQGDSAEGEER